MSRATRCSYSTSKPEQIADCRLRIADCHYALALAHNLDGGNDHEKECRFFHGSALQSLLIRNPKSEIGNPKSEVAGERVDLRIAQSFHDSRRVFGLGSVTNHCGHGSGHA